MKFICGYCGLHNFGTWDALIDHLINDHRFFVKLNKLVRR